MCISRVCSADEIIVLRGKIDEIKKAMLGNAGNVAGRRSGAHACL